MPKADKLTVRKRINDVARLVLAGAELSDIRQFAVEQQWSVTDRQIHRYLDLAYKRLAKSSKRPKDELRGRHLMQRRALYARSVKNNDLRTALQILRDEATMQGLYPATKIEATASAEEKAAVLSAVPRKDRLVRLVNAMAKNDTVEVKLLESTTPVYSYHHADTVMPLEMLNVQALLYVQSKLDILAWFLQCMWCLVSLGGPNGKEDSPATQLSLCGMVFCYRFKAEKEAWEQYTKELGVDGDFLIRINSVGTSLYDLGAYLCKNAPTKEDFEEWYHSKYEDKEPVSVESIVRTWHREIRPLLQDHTADPNYMASEHPSRDPLCASIGKIAERHNQRRLT